MTRLETSRSSSSAAAKRPLHPTRTNAAAVGVFLLLQTLAGLTDATACNMTVTNAWNFSVSLYSYDDLDTTCSNPYASYTVEGYGTGKPTLTCSLVSPTVWLTACNSPTHGSQFPFFFCLFIDPPPIAEVVMDCNNFDDCRIMLNGPITPGSCLGLWEFGCGDQLKFWYKPGGAPVWSSIEVDGTDDNARRLVEGPAAA
jgi:hypothetical protein